MRCFIYAASALILAGYASTALAYTPQWLECTGDVTVTPNGGPATKAAAKDIYVFDPDAKNLFKYSEDRKSLAYLGAKPGTTDMDIRWSGTGSGIGGSSWEGQFDRTGMSLRLTYKAEGETRAWAETCAPTAPRQEG
jgi:hypothetical protein